MVEAAPPGAPGGGIGFFAEDCMTAGEQVTETAVETLAARDSRGRGLVQKVGICLSVTTYVIGWTGRPLAPDRCGPGCL